MDTNMSDSNENTPRDTLDKNQALARASDVDEMKQWAQGFKVNKPIPVDLLPILARDNVKQMEIVMKNMSLGERKTGGGA
jgi:hypothetical protein